MKSFLVKGKKPIVKWGMIPDGTFYEGAVPEGFKLAVCPSENYIVIDVDRHKNKDGFKHLPPHLCKELSSTLQYATKNNGVHYWLRYTGNKTLINKASNLGIDLRTNKGYVVWYKEEDIRHMLDKINNSSDELNVWLEELFSTSKLKKHDK